MFIGIDLGTSAVKLLLMGDEGQILKTCSREYPLYFPQSGWSEQNPKDWVEQSLEGIKDLLADYPDARVDGIGVGGQMHGLVILDENDQVIRPAILWNDGRTGEETDYLNTVIGREKLTDYTGNIAFAGFTAPKLLWLYNHEKESFDRISRIMLPKDYLVYCLTGAHVTDFSDASGMLLLDVEHKCWSKEMLDICHIREAMMPQLKESFEVVGSVKEEIKNLLGVRGEMKVVAGAGDNAAAAIGTGAVGAGRCNLSLGTSGTIFITADHYSKGDGSSLHNFANADGKYHLMGCMLSAASCNKWWMDTILQDTDYNANQAEIGELGLNHVFFQPYLMGERSPHNDPAARAMFIGMSMDTTRADMTQAVLEGVAFGLRDSFENAKKLGISIESASICGGGAKSPLWRKIVANVLGIPIHTVENDEGPSLGGAILAAVGCGKFDSLKAACEEVVREKEVTLPDPQLTKRYNERYAEFVKLYPMTKGFFR
ncbi:MAG: xylulokinase [Firmicutes bacterium]|nr:xylulokinase [Bacillota bacterium]